MHCEYMTGYNIQTASQALIKGAEDHGADEKMKTTTLIVLTFFTSLCACALVVMLVMIFRTKRNDDRNIETPDEVDQIPRDSTDAPKNTSHDLNLNHTDEDWTTKTDDETHFSIDGVEMEDIEDESKIV